MSAKTAVGGFADNWQKWLPLLAALFALGVALGILPKRWGRVASMAALIFWLRGLLGE
jgi:hypothetical protein